jgi:hypothetical protein
VRSEVQARKEIWLYYSFRLISRICQLFSSVFFTINQSTVLSVMTYQPNNVYLVLRFSLLMGGDVLSPIASACGGR